jgi:N-acyl-D-amino-acid deacylase
MQNENYDLIIRNAVIIDGTRAPRFEGELGIRAGRIAKVGKAPGDLRGARAEREIDAGGRIAAPGFIDAHTHDDRLLLSSPDMSAKVSQGVTTVVSGNCGVSLAPMVHQSGPVTPPLDLLDSGGSWYRFPSFAAYFEELASSPAATNFAPMVGHTTLRVMSMGDVERPANAKEIARMQALAREALASGAIGISTGTFYEPAAAAPTAEIVEVCRPLTEFKGLYVTHMRDEADRVIEALDETFLIGRSLGVQVVISHHKVAGLPNHGRSTETLAHISKHMATQPIGMDCYPYCASSTILTWSRVGGASKVLVTWSNPHPEFSGMELSAVADRLGLSQEAAVAKLLPAGAIYFAMDENDVQRILKFERTMVGSDGLPHDAAPHPRLWGTFPRVLGHYSRDLGLFPLETAVHKMTGLTAATFGLADRGVIREGAWADITLFDAERVAEGASFAKPIQPAHGIDTVIVNGVPVWREGRPTGARPGRHLRRTPTRA